MKGKKNNSIEAFRFIFMLVICLWHYMDAREFLKHGYIGVEFYFILSGVFLYLSTAKDNILSPLDYAIKRFKRFNPKYAVSVLVTYLYLYLPDVFKGNGAFWSDQRYIGVVPDLFMLQSIGVFNGLGGVNKPLWYISVLFIGGNIVYSIIYCNKKYAMFILLPLICILGYTYLFHCSTENSIENWGINGYVCSPLLRGICDISLGTLIGYVISNKKGFFGRHSLLISLSSIVSIIWILFLLVIKNPYDNISLIVFTILIIGCFSEHSIINRVFSSKIWCNLGTLSYSMLLLHYPVLLITKRLLSLIEFDNNYLIIALYITNVIVCSWLFDKAFNNGLKVLSLTNKS